MRKRNKENRTKEKNNKFYSLNNKQKKLIELSRKIKSENSSYFYGPATSGGAPASSVASSVAGS